MKQIGFAGDLVPKVLNGTKTSTIRLFSEHRFEEGETVAVIDSTKDECIGHGLLTGVYTKFLGELHEADLAGNGAYSSKDAMYATLQKFYPDKKVDHHSPATVVRFVFSPLTLQDNE